MKKIYLLLFSVISFAQVFAQTNPPAQAVPYSQDFATFTGTTTTYPAGIQGWTIAGSTSTSFPTAAPNGDQALIAATNATVSAHVGDYNGKIGFLSTGNALKSIALSINTTGISNVQVSFLAATQRQESAARIGAIGLQYRVGTTGIFTNVTGSEYQNPGGTNNTSGTGSLNPQTIMVTLPAAADGQPVVELRWVYREVSGGGNRPGFSIDDIAVTGGSGPSVSASTSNLTFNYVAGAGPDVEQFTVSGTNLTANATVTTNSSNYEVSLDGTTYSSSVVLIQSGGTLTGQPVNVFVRLIAGLAIGTYNSTLTISSTGAPNATVNLSGSVTGTPTLTAMPSSLTGFSTTQGTASASQSFTVDGTNLTSNVTVTAPTDYEVSLNNTTFSTSVTITPTGGTVSSQLVYVRIRALAPQGSPSGNVTVVSGSLSQNVAVSGTVASGPTISAMPSSLTGFSSTQGTASASQTFTVNGSNLTANVIVTAPANYEVSLDGTTYSASVSITPTSGSVTSVTVYVRLKANAAVGSPSGNVTVASTGAITQNVAVSGTVAPGTPTAFTQGNLTVYRVGDGGTALSAAAAPVYIDEFTPSGTLVQTILLPTTASGGNRAVTASGNATTEGLITRSTDKRYLMVTGYDATVGTMSVNTSTSATVNRVVGRIAYNVAIDATTALTDYASGGNPRGVTSTNGTDIWVSSGVDGVKYTMLSATTSTQLSTTPTNLRAVNIFDNQLYVSSASGTIRLATVGAGTPTTSGQTITNLPGFPTSGGSPYGFFFADLDAGVAGVDVVYVADDGSGTGFQKYSLVAGNWTANGNIAVTGNGLRSVTGMVSGSTVTLYGTSGTSLFSLVDASGYNATITGTVNTLGTAGANTAFRGIAFAPENISLPVRFSSLKATQKSNGIQLDWSNATEENVIDYTIERSANGRNFNRLDKVAARNNNNSRADYSFIDASPLSGDNFYRIKAVETTGKTIYTNIVRINTNKKGTELVVYPNPVSSTELGIQLSNLPAGNYALRIINNSGQIVGSRNFVHGGGSMTETIGLNNLINGIYTLEINGAVKLQKQFLKQ